MLLPPVSLCVHGEAVDGAGIASAGAEWVSATEGSAATCRWRAECMPLIPTCVTDAAHLSGQHVLLVLRSARPSGRGAPPALLGQGALPVALSAGEDAPFSVTLLSKGVPVGTLTGRAQLCDERGDPLPNPKMRRVSQSISRMMQKSFSAVGVSRTSSIHSGNRGEDSPERSSSLHRGSINRGSMMRAGGSSAEDGVGEEGSMSVERRGSGRVSWAPRFIPGRRNSHRMSAATPRVDSALDEGITEEGPSQAPTPVGTPRGRESDCDEAYRQELSTDSGMGEEEDQDHRTSQTAEAWGAGRQSQPSAGSVP
jgi:hypothetical protein